MIVALASLLALGLAGLLGWHGAPREDSGRRPFTANPRSVAGAAAVIVAAFAARLTVVWAAVHAGSQPAPDWLQALPLPVIDDRAPRFGHAPYGTLAGVAAVIETAGLAWLFAALDGRRAGLANRRIVAGAFIVMAILALASRCLTSFDLYAYAGAVHLGLAAGYHPSAVAFTGEWAVLDRIYGTPIPPSPYGPLWLLVSFAAAGWNPSLGGALAGLRLLELAAFASCIVALRAMHVPAASLAVFALNPALFGSYVVDGHNDLLGAALVLGAAALRTRSPPLALALAGAAGAIKLPFLIVAPLAFAGVTSVRRRALAGLSAVALGALVSLLFGGSAYLASLRETARIYRSAISSPALNALHVAVASSAVLAVVAVVARRRYLPTAGWTFAALGAALFGWYFAWGIPYAVAERRWLGPFLISLPWLGFISSTIYTPTLLGVDGFYVTCLLGPILAASALRSERPKAAGI